jgi:hypothetical protein
VASEGRESYASSYAGKAADGVYYYGGSWMRIEICGYVMGKLHGWSKVEHVIANQLWAEVHTDEDFPTSQKYLPKERKILRRSPRLCMEFIYASVLGNGWTASAGDGYRLSKKAMSKKAVATNQSVVSIGPF